MYNSLIFEVLTMELLINSLKLNKGVFLPSQYEVEDFLYDCIVTGVKPAQVIKSKVGYFISLKKVFNHSSQASSESFPTEAVVINPVYGICEGEKVIINYET